VYKSLTLKHIHKDWTDYGDYLIVIANQLSTPHQHPEITYKGNIREIENWLVRFPFPGGRIFVDGHDHHVEQLQLFAISEGLNHLKIIPVDKYIKVGYNYNK